jgi:acetyl esterase/lipase
MPVFHPDLASGRFIPKLSFSPLVLRLMGNRGPKVGPVPDDIVTEDVTVPGEHPVQLRVYRPVSLPPGSPALFWIHGGGFISGSLEQDQRTNIEFARRLGITVVALRYRIAPQHPSPAAIEDAYAGLNWLFGAAAERGIDPTRVAIGGASAGAGLAAALALYALDKGEVAPVFQLLIYPMLDDRTAVRTDHDTRNARVWTAKSNHFAWTSYLGTAPGGPGVSPYAAPARRDDLKGLPPAWIGVGTLDVFFDEDVEYARRLVDAGVACELEIVPGAFHGFDALYTKKDVSRRFLDAQVAALRGAFGAGGA